MEKEEDQECNSITENFNKILSRLKTPYEETLYISVDLTSHRFHVGGSTKGSTFLQQHTEFAQKFYDFCCDTYDKNKDQRKGLIQKTSTELSESPKRSVYRKGTKRKVNRKNKIAEEDSDWTVTCNTSDDLANNTLSTPRRKSSRISVTGFDVLKSAKLRKARMDEQLTCVKTSTPTLRKARMDEQLTCVKTSTPTKSSKGKTTQKRKENEIPESHKNIKKVTYERNKNTEKSNTIDKSIESKKVIDSSDDHESVCIEQASNEMDHRDDVSTVEGTLSKEIISTDTEGTDESMVEKLADGVKDDIDLDKDNKAIANTLGKPETKRDQGGNKKGVLKMKKSKLQYLQCKFCRKTLEAKKYPAHLRYTHKQLNSFKCTQCVRSFHTSISLNKHMRTHADENKEESTVNENSKENPADENSKENPASENNKENPIDKNSKENPSDENNKDYPANKINKENPIDENNKINPANENNIESSDNENSKENPADENKENPVSSEKYEGHKILTRESESKALCQKAVKAEQDEKDQLDIDGKMEVTCHLCLRKLRTKEGLENHMLLHSSFVCRICDKSFMSKQRMEKHLRCHNGQCFTCDICSKEFALGEGYIDHMRKLHGDKRESCYRCGLFFENVLDKNKHMETHQTFQFNKNYACFKCGKMYELYKYLKQHVRTSHKSMEEICKVCCEFFPSRVDLKKHMWKHRLDFAHSCKVCKSSFVSSEELTKHMRETHENQMFVCEVCGEQFSSRHDLKKHHQYIHSGKVFECSICHYKSAKKGLFEAHMKQVHATSRDYKCDICNMLFKTPGVLKKHLKTHTTEKGHKCGLCESEFRSFEGLNNHILDHHYDEINPENLNFSVYECEHCGKRTSQKSIHIRHMRNHTGERPHECHMCGRKFPIPAALNRHIRLFHMGMKKFACNICNIKFGQNSHLERHLRSTVHKKRLHASEEHPPLKSTERPLVKRIVSAGFPSHVELNSEPVQHFNSDVMPEETHHQETVETENIKVFYLDSKTESSIDFSEQQVLTIENSSMVNLSESTIYVISETEDPNVFVQLKQEDVDEIEMVNSVIEQSGVE